MKLMHQRNTNCHQMESQIETLQGVESSVSLSTIQWQTQVTFHSTLHAGLLGLPVLYTGHPQVLTKG